MTAKHTKTKKPLSNVKPWNSWKIQKNQPGSWGKSVVERICEGHKWKVL